MGCGLPPHGGHLPGRDTSVTRLSLRFTLAGLAEGHIRAMAGRTAVAVYHLDGDALRVEAARIGAPSVGELSQPVDEVPEGASPFAFRTVGPWA